MTKTLDSSPSILPLYARAALPMIPGASLLPFVPGGGGEIPDGLDLELAGVSAKSADVAAYAKVCGFALRDTLPPTYPHMLAFPLHMAVMSDGSLPVRRGRPRPRRELDRPEAADRDRRGDDDPRAADASCSRTRRGRPSRWRPRSWSTARSSGRASARCSAAARATTSCPRRRRSGFDSARPADAPASAEWKLGGDLGRRYAGVSGDRNPIHMHSLTAKPLGFPGAIAHGMWTKARALAQLESKLARQLRGRRPLPQAGPVAGARRVRQPRAGRRDPLRRPRREEGHPTPRRPRAAANDSNESKPNSKTAKTGRKTTSDHHHREQGDGGAQHGLRPAGAEPPRRLRPAGPHPHPQAGREGPLPGHQERLPHRHRGRPHLQGRPAAGQTGAPEEGQIEGALRPLARRRAADVPGGAAAPSPPTRSARRRWRPTRSARRRRRSSTRRTSWASTCSASPRSSAA